MQLECCLWVNICYDIHELHVPFCLFFKVSWLSQQPDFIKFFYLSTTS